jgi:hypothetical protein
VAPAGGSGAYHRFHVLADDGSSVAGVGVFVDDALEAGTEVHEEGCFEADHVELFSKGKDKEGAPAEHVGGLDGSATCLGMALEFLEHRVTAF